MSSRLGAGCTHCYDFVYQEWLSQFSYQCVNPIHAKVVSIQILLHFIQIASRVCTLVLFQYVWELELSEVALTEHSIFFFPSHGYY